MIYCFRTPVAPKVVPSSVPVSSTDTIMSALSQLKLAYADSTTGEFKISNSVCVVYVFPFKTLFIPWEDI